MALLSNQSPLRQTRSTRLPTPDVSDMSSSPTASQDSTISKPKRKPTVTPRTFTRFFTPRSLTGRVRKVGGSSRQALKELTASASNRKFGSNGQLATGVTALYSDGDVFFADIPTPSKKRGLLSPDASPEASRPLKRQHDQSTTTDEKVVEFQDDAASVDIMVEDSEDEELDTEAVKLPLAIKRAKYRTQLGGVLRRELDNLSTRPTRVDYGNSWRSETANFYSRPEDKHTCYNTTVAPVHIALPFCVTSCKTNSLVAIGDEEGSVRLQESSAEDKLGFSKTYLSFRPHSNAILDLEFSEDDKLLATASGDQSSNIVDMLSQQIIHTLSIHRSSVKQILFQPGSSSSVLATSSRDGTVQIWDLRCAGLKVAVRKLKVAEDSPNAQNGEQPRTVNWAKPVNTISNGHGRRGLLYEEVAAIPDTPSRSEAHGRFGDVSVTTMSFLDASRPHLLMTGSQVNASVKLWDLRTTHTSRRGRPTPLSTTRRPESHDRHRQFALTSMVLSGDASRLYTLCRDNTIYAYSTSHLILGHAPELSSTTDTKSKKKVVLEKDGLGPLYGFRHPLFQAATFYVKLALRPAFSDKPELLAAGSSNSCAVLFPTDERYLPRQNPCVPKPPFAPIPPSGQAPSTRSNSASTRLIDTIPIYQKGTALIRGHDKEVTGLAWTTNGDLVTVGDDLTARCWRDGNGEEARKLRTGGEENGQRWNCGWACIDEKVGWDDDE